MIKRSMKIICIGGFLFFYQQLAMAMPPAIAKHGMVVSEQKIASEVGVKILKAGGNAIDAAVAVGYALAVVNPCCGNIGGGGFMTIHLANGQNIFLNFREKAPLKANKKMFLQATENASTQGYLAVAVPGTVLGLETALEKYGSMSRKEVMQPAIDLAYQGYIITPYAAKQFQQYADDFRKQPTVAAIFLKNNQPYQAGERLIQTDLGNTLKAIAEKGPDVFYKGYIANTIVKKSQAEGGILTRQDFTNYFVTISMPIRCQYRGYEIISAPPPSSGGVTLCEILNILANFPLQQLGYHSAESIRIIVEAMRYGFVDRNTKLGDPDFVQNPIQGLTAKSYAYQLSQKILHSRFAPKKICPLQHRELTDTTHYSVIDKKGNAVSVTYTLNGFFGAHIIAGETGFFLNNEMDDFATLPGTVNKFGLMQSLDANNIQPGKRPLSSMTPTIVMKDGRVLLVIGSPGGPRIITAVLLTLINMLDYHLNLQQAVDAPRFHYQGEPDEIAIEPFAVSFLTRKKLHYLGYQIKEQPTWAAIEAILVDTDGMRYGVNDKRRPDGAAIGY